LKEEQERLRHRQVELERMRRAAEEKQNRPERAHADNRRRRRHHRQRDLNDSKDDEEKKSRLHGRQGKNEIDWNRLEREEKAAAKLQASHHDLLSRQAAAHEQQRK
jgi:hypothetical protein